MKRKLVYLLIFLIVPLIFLTSCDSREKEVTVGFLYAGSAADQGIHEAQDLAREEMVEYFNGAVETIVKESVTPENISGIINDMISQGTSIIFLSDSTCQEQVLAAANAYPDVKFIVYTGTETAPNLKNYSSRTYEADYLTGIIAGCSTSNNLIGYLAPDRSPFNLVDINAFALGVMRANPNAIVEVDFTGLPFSKSRLNAAVSKLTFDGCDVISSDLPNNTALIEAANRGVKIIGRTASGLESSDNLLTTLTIDFKNFYIQIIESVLDGSFNSTRYVGTVADGFIGLSDYSMNVNQVARDTVEQAQEEIKNGNLAVFTGPITDGEGNTVAQDGQVLSEVELASMNYTVSNVRVLE